MGLHAPEQGFLPAPLFFEHASYPNGWIIVFVLFLVNLLFVYYNACTVLLFDDRYFGVVKRVVEAARSRILISQFKIDSVGISGNSCVNQLLVTLVKKAEAGVNVKLLLDCILPLRGRSANNAFVALWLKKHRIDVRFLPQNRCQHAKFLTVDGGHLIVGSHNWTVNSLKRNSECSVYLTDVLSVSVAEAEGSRLFDAGKEFGPGPSGSRGRA